jgi:hypothetical protein
MLVAAAVVAGNVDYRTMCRRVGGLRCGIDLENRIPVLEEEARVAGARRETALLSHFFTGRFAG